MWAWIYRLSSPKPFYYLAAHLIPWFAGVSIILFIYGLLSALVFVPSDYQQGDAFRIIYVHVPSAVLSVFVYFIIGICSAIGMIWRIKMAHIIARSSAVLGASFTLLALITGAIWGKPMWGVWWVWDARLTSELILLFLYIGYIAIYDAIADKKKAAQAAGLLAIIGLINLPIIHYSVEWWNTLHQGATVLKFGESTLHVSMRYPLYAMLMAFMCYYVAVMLMRARSEVIKSEQRSQWVKKLVQQR